MGCGKMGISLPHAHQEAKTNPHTISFSKIAELIYSSCHPYQNKGHRKHMIGQVPIRKGAITFNKI
jgi:hypothetical protein